MPMPACFDPRCSSCNALIREMELDRERERNRVREPDEIPFDDIEEWGIDDGGSEECQKYLREVYVQN